MDAWLVEVIELHDYFEAYFLGTVEGLERVESALAQDFTMVGPAGITFSRGQTIGLIEGGHSHASALEMTITEPELLFEDGETLVASYVENQQWADVANHRLTTVVFSKDDSAPNGLVWRRIHVTWVNADN